MSSIFIKFLFIVYLFYDFVKLHSDNRPFFVYTFKGGVHCGFLHEPGGGEMFAIDEVYRRYRVKMS